MGRALARSHQPRESGGCQAAQQPSGCPKEIADYFDCMSCSNLSSILSYRTPGDPRAREWLVRARTLVPKDFQQLADVARRDFYATIVDAHAKLLAEKAQPAAPQEAGKSAPWAKREGKSNRAGPSIEHGTSAPATK